MGLRYFFLVFLFFNFLPVLLDLQIFLQSYSPDKSLTMKIGICIIYTAMANTDRKRD